MRLLPCPALFVALLGCSSLVTAADRPNIVWILTEDNSKHYLQLFDPAGVKSPHLESMARQGVVFDRAFSNAPVCSVARTTLITSCYGPRIGTQFHRRSQLAAMPEGLEMFPAYLRAAGYYTTNNSKKDYNAVEGPDVWDASSKKATWRDRPTAETPFFHVQTFTQSHESSLHFSNAKMQSEATTNAPEEVTLAPYHPDTPTFRYTHARYLDRMQANDQAIGNLLRQLADDGLLEDTFVFCFGDHGGVLPRGKGYAYESGLHVPLVVRIPENWQSRSPFSRGSRTEGFVEFVDFGPTVLQLAGLSVPTGIDGKPFLGASVTAAEVEARNEAFGYADRFDEKYDLVRTLRVGRYKYMRNYEAFNPDGLQNNYRYNMLAFQEWRKRYLAGELNATQSRFFETKPVEALFDLENDPYEIHNLATDPQHQDRLVDLRERLRLRLKAMPDLSFIPESVLVPQAMQNPVAFGQAYRNSIARLIDTIDSCLLPPEASTAALRKALQSNAPLERMWASVACSCLGEQASELSGVAQQLLAEDPHRLTRVRAAQFLSILGQLDPTATIYRELAAAESELEALEILNVAVCLQDHLLPGIQLDPAKLRLSVNAGPRSEVRRRLDYLQERFQHSGAFSQ